VAPIEKEDSLMMTVSDERDRAAHERILADAIVDVATELRLADPTEFILMIRGDQAANITDLVNSSSELFFKGGALRYALAAGCELRWESTPIVCLDMEFRHESVTVFFRLTIGRARAAVEVIELLFEGEAPLGGPDERERFAAAIAHARLM
jgi:hypothetical protein